jgi:hypothetical protein
MQTNKFSEQSCSKQSCQNGRKAANIVANISIVANMTALAKSQLIFKPKVVGLSFWDWIPCREEAPGQALPHSKTSKDGEGEKKKRLNR